MSCSCSVPLSVDEISELASWHDAFDTRNPRVRVTYRMVRPGHGWMQKGSPMWIRISTG